MDFAPYAGAAEAGANLLNGIVKRVLPEKISEETAAKLNQELTLAILKGELDPMLAQLRVNEEEAKSDNVFVSGWRPAVGWTCVGALAWTFVLAPFTVFWLGVAKVEVPPLPVLDYTSLMPILLGMLGLGGMRTYEKVRGVENAKVGK